VNIYSFTYEVLVLNHDFEKNYLAGLEALQDIQALSSEDLSTPINRAFFHLSEVKRSSINMQQEHSLGSLPGVTKFLEHSLGLMVEEQLSDSSLISQIQCGYNLEQSSPEILDRMLASMPHLFSVVKQLGLGGQLDIKMESTATTIVGEIKEQMDLERVRVGVYAATRALLRLGTILTFRVLNHSDERRTTAIELTFNYRHSFSRGYVVHLTQNQPALIFSSSFIDYLLPKDTVYTLGTHHCVEITSDLQVEVHQGLPECCDRGETQQEIVHFNFLFRPISLIIPSKGKIFPIVPVESGALTGSGESCFEIQDDICRGQKTSLYVDIFKLLSK
jgi:hypothetical protein